MRTFTRALTATLAATTIAATAIPAALAQDSVQQDKQEAVGSASTIAQLEVADQSLNGDVKVVRNGKEVSVTYTNSGTDVARCSGMAISYDEVQKHGLTELDTTDPNFQPMSLATTFVQIMATGEAAVYGYSYDPRTRLTGESPVSYNGAEAPAALLTVGLAGATQSSRLPAIAPGESVTWTVTKPEQDAVGIVLCNGSLQDSSSLEVNFGIEKDVFFNQIKDTLGSAGGATALSTASPGVEGSVISSLGGVLSILKFFAGIFEGFFNTVGKPLGFTYADVAKTSSDATSSLSKEETENAA